MSLPRIAHAHCAEGREVSAATDGRCCWPGQRWNHDAARCEGSPNCPPGLFADGESCEAPARTASESAASPATEYDSPGSLSRPTSVSVYVPGTPVLPPAQPEPEKIDTPIEELVIAGGVVASIGYGFSIVMGIIHLLPEVSKWCPGDGWTAFIPLVGGFIWAGTPGVCPFPSGPVFGGIGSGVQAVGLLLMLIGSFAQESTPVEPALREASLLPELVDGPGEAGLGLRWRF